MGLLSFLRGRTDDGEDVRSEAPAMPEMFKGMALNVTLQSGGALMTGQLADRTEDSVTISRVTGQISLPVCQPGTAVVVRGYGSGTRPFDLKGIVRSSSRILCTVNNLELIPFNEQRSSFRLPLSIPVSLYLEDDKRLQNPEGCMLVNISTGGACVESEYAHGEGEIIRMRVKIEDYSPMAFLGEIIRVEEVPQRNIFRYGILFAQLDPQETSTLTKILFNVQVGNKRAHSRNREGPGYWSL